MIVEIHEDKSLLRQIHTIEFVDFLCPVDVSPAVNAHDNRKFFFRPSRIVYVQKIPGILTSRVIDIFLCRNIRRLLQVRVSLRVSLPRQLAEHKSCKRHRLLTPFRTSYRISLL